MERVPRIRSGDDQCLEFNRGESIEYFTQSCLDSQIWSDGSGLGNLVL